MVHKLLTIILCFLSSFMLFAELVDAVDENDQVIETVDRKKVYGDDFKQYYRVVNVIIEDSNGKIFVPIRNANRYFCPLSMDASASGHVQSGESYEEAALREIFEETGLNISLGNLTLVKYLTPRELCGRAFTKVYHVRADSIPKFSEEWERSSWEDPVFALELINGGQKAKTDYKEILLEFISWKSRRSI